jgi:SpoVK/Ycf46/Vps4 family AAA+-type ATPase
MLESERRVLALADAGKASLELLAKMEAAHDVFKSGEDRFSEAGDFSGFTSLHTLHAIGELMSSVVSPTAYRLHEIVKLRDAYESRAPDPGEAAERGYGGFAMRRPSRGIEPRLEASELALAESNAVKVAENRLQFPSIVNTTYQGAVSLYRYYQKRFVSIEQPSGRLFQPAPDEMDPSPDTRASAVACAKIELAAGSPMLTDVLLDLVAHVPRRYSRPKHGRKKKGEKKEEEKFVDSFEVERAAGILAELADPSCMEYMRDPAVFFERVAGLYSDFHTVAARTKGPVDVILDYLASSSTIQFNRRKLEAPVPNPASMLARMRNINFNSIRPTEDDLKPRSDSERRYFAARKKLVNHLHEALEALSQAPEAVRYERAKASLEKAIGLKEAMEQAQKTSRTMVVEKDKKDRNEFYVGSSGGMKGEFTFVREAAPKIRMRDVYGASFDDMKAHVEDLAVYSRFPRLYRATAPRGKIRSNLIAIGPYGCGKTEIGRAIGGDPRFIGAEVNVTTALTCMFGEFEKNVDRIWDGAAALRAASGGEKLVFLLMDEFDGWFGNTNGHWVDETYRRVQKAIQMKLDGIVDYEGIITVGFTNEPAKIPLAIYRRFKYVDIVGELNQEERSSLLKHFLTNGLPLSRGFTEAHWEEWGERLEGATGDVIGKVADDVHYELMRGFIADHPKDARQIESLIRKRELSGANDRGIKSETKRLIAAHASVTPDWVERTLANKLAEPTIREQVETAKRVYAEARDVMRKLHMRKDAASGSRAPKKPTPVAPFSKKTMN